MDVGELDMFLDKLTRPALGLDVIVIEASRLDEPQELVRMLLASEKTAPLAAGAAVGDVGAVRPRAALRVPTPGAGAWGSCRSRICTTTITTAILHAA